LRRAFDGARVIPVHTAQASRYRELFGDVARLEDGQWLGV